MPDGLERAGWNEAPGLEHSAFADRLRNMSFVIDRVDLLAYAGGDARVCDAAASTLSVPLAIAAAYYLRVTVPEGCVEPLTLVCWEPGHELVVEDGADLMPQITEGAQIYASGRLHRRILAADGETLCRNEVVCSAANVIVLKGPSGRQTLGPLALRLDHAQPPRTQRRASRRILHAPRLRRHALRLVPGRLRRRRRRLHSLPHLSRHVGPGELEVNAEARERLGPGTPAYVTGLGRREIDSWSRVQFDAAGQMHFDTHVLQRAVVRVADGADEGVASAVVRDHQRDAFPFLACDLGLPVLRPGFSGLSALASRAAVRAGHCLAARQAVATVWRVRWMP